MGLGSNEGASCDGDDGDFGMRLGRVIKTDGCEVGGTQDAEADWIWGFGNIEILKFVVPSMESKEELRKRSSVVGLVGGEEQAVNA